MISWRAEHPIVANDGGDARLRWLDAAPFDVALEQAKRLQRRYRTGILLALDHDEMHKVPSPSFKAK
jgi:hypothetical protein